MKQQKSVILASQIINFCKSHFGASIVNFHRDFEILSPVSIDNIANNRVGFWKGDGPPKLANRFEPNDFLLILESRAASSGGVSILVKNARLVFGKVIEEFFVESVAREVSPCAYIDASASIGANVTIGSGSYVGARCVISDGVRIGNNVILSKDVSLGENSCILSNSVIGEDGFATEFDETGNLYSLPHVGGVKIGHNVQIGSMNSIASGTVEPTIISDYTKTDNLVHIAHNVKIGKNCQIAACAEISGSVVIGNKVWIAPNCSIIQKVSIGDGAMVGIGAVVTKSIPPSTLVAGNPARFVKKLKGSDVE